MKMIALGLLFSLVMSSLSYASTKATPKTSNSRKCSVFAGTNPYIFDRLLAKTSGAGVGIVAVKKDQSAGVVLSPDEFSRRSKVNDFAEFAGGTLFFFNPQTDGSWTVMGVSFGSAAPYELDGAVQALGGPRRAPVALVLVDKHLYAVCR